MRSFSILPADTGATVRGATEIAGTIGTTIGTTIGMTIGGTIATTSVDRIAAVREPAGAAGARVGHPAGSRRTAC